MKVVTNGMNIRRISIIGVAVVLTMSNFIFFALQANVFALAEPQLAFQREDQSSAESRSVIDSALSAAGNLYQVGNIAGETNVDPTGGSDVRTPDGQVGYVRVLSSTGAYIKTLLLDNTESDSQSSISSIAFTKDKSAYYVTGWHKGSADFDFSTGETIRTTDTNYNSNGFVAMYNTADDSLQSVQILESRHGWSNVYGIAVNPAGGNVVIYGSYEVEVDLDPSESEDYRSTSGSDHHVAFLSYYTANLSYSNSFVYDADQDATINTSIDAATFTHSGNLIYALDVMNHDSQNGASVTIGLGPYGGNEQHAFNLGRSSSGMSIITLDSEGSYVSGWTFDPDLSTDWAYVGVYDIVVDASDNVYYAGGAHGSVDLNPEGEANDDRTFDSAGFVTKMNSDGTYGYSYDQATAGMSNWFTQLVVDDAGSAYALGIAYASGAKEYDLNPGDGVDSKYLADYHTLLVQIDADGSYGYGIVSGSTNSAVHRVTTGSGSIARDATGNLYVSANAQYIYQIQDSESCEMNNARQYGSGTTKFSAAGVASRGWLDFNAIPDQYVEGCDSDGDGISDEGEANIQNGDANGDSIADNTQSNVAAVANSVTSQTAAIEVTDCSLSNVSVKAEGDYTLDNAYNYPLGLFGFKATCGDPGATTTVTQYFYNPPAGEFTVRKVVNGVYADVAGATVETRTINGQPVLVVSYSVTDGGPLDEDGEANGVIIDPVGPAVLSTASVGSGAGSGSDSDSGVSVPGVPNTGFVSRGLSGLSGFVFAATTGLVIVLVAMAFGIRKLTKRPL